jgi:hypothetical protein
MQIQIQNLIFTPSISAGAVSPVPANAILDEGGQPIAGEGGEFVIGE